MTAVPFFSMMYIGSARAVSTTSVTMIDSVSPANIFIHLVVV